MALTKESSHAEERFSEKKAKERKKPDLPRLHAVPLTSVGVRTKARSSRLGMSERMKGGKNGVDPWVTSRGE